MARPNAAIILNIAFYMLNTCKHTEAQNLLLWFFFFFPVQCRRFFFFFFFLNSHLRHWNISEPAIWYFQCIQNIIVQMLVQCSTSFFRSLKAYQYIAQQKELCQNMHIKKWMHNTGRYRTSSEIKQNKSLLKTINALF